MSAHQSFCGFTVYFWRHILPGNISGVQKLFLYSSKRSVSPKGYKQKSSSTFLAQKHLKSKHLSLVLAEESWQQLEKLFTLFPPLINWTSEVAWTYVTSLGDWGCSEAMWAGEFNEWVMSWERSLFNPAGSERRHSRTTVSVNKTLTPFWMASDEGHMLHTAKNTLKMFFRGSIEQ